MKVLSSFILTLIISLPAFAGDIDSFLASRSVTGQIYFARNSSILSEKNKSELSKLIKELHRQERAGKLIRIEGHASTDGQDAVNFDLSIQRALAIKDYLRQRGLKVDIFLTGFGEKSSSAGKLTKQRRVDIAVYDRNRETEKLFQQSDQVERFIIQ